MKRKVVTACLVTLFLGSMLSAHATEEKTFATVSKLAGASWFQRLASGVNEYGNETAGVRTFEQGPSQADVAQQGQLIEDLIAQKIDGIGVVPLSPNSLEALLKKARSNGMVVVTHEGAGMTNVDYNIDAFNNEDYGRHFMDALAERMNEKGEYVVFVGNLTNVTHNIWVEAAIQHQKSNYPNMTLVGDKFVSNEDAQVAYRKTQEILVTNPNVRGFIGSASIDVVGIGQAIYEAGLGDVTTVVGTSIVSVAGSGLEDGVIDMISFWDPAVAGKAMNEIMKRVTEGKKIASGDSLGLPGYESVTVEEKDIMGSAWIDVTVDNMNDYNF
ncbi:autoinducer 2 ABC transporter substrate-binding protein [Photobacterium sp. DNB23_23_1]